MSNPLKSDRRDVAEQVVSLAGWKFLSAVSYDPGHLDRLGPSADWFIDPQQRTIFVALAAFHRERPTASMVTASELARFMATAPGLSHLIHDDAEFGDVQTVSLSILHNAFDNAFFDDGFAPSNANVLREAALQRQTVERLAEVTQAATNPQELALQVQRLADDLSAQVSPGPQTIPVDVTVLPVDGDDRPPARLGRAAFWGPAGEFVRLVLPHTESDPAALLFHFLTYAAGMFGRSRYFVVDAAEHFPSLFVAFVGASSKGRKGTAQRNCEWLFRLVDGPLGTFLQTNVVSGLSSGEGLIHQVRDATVKDGAVVDDGCPDKRLLVVESEFGGTLRVGRREGSILSAVLRDAWDRGRLRTLTKHSPVTATGAHICVVGHIVREELRRMMGGSDQFNGFANRFLWVFTQRSKLLPNGGSLREDVFRGLADTVRAAVEFAQVPGRMTRSPAAAELWETLYADLAADRPGVLGAVTNRAEAQVLRLSMIYALLDGTDVIDEPHLRAALECWRYAEDSARYAFGSALGDATADEIRSMLLAAGETGMTRTALSEAFGRNKPAAEIRRALGVLQRSRLAHCRKLPSGGGRPAEVWFAGPEPDEGDETNEGNEQSPSDSRGPGGLPSSHSFLSLPNESPAEGYVPRRPVGRVLDDAEVDRIDTLFNGGNHA